MLQLLRKWREGLCNDWMEGRLQEDTEYKTGILLAKALGNLQTVRALEQLDYETLQSELEND